MSDVNELLYIIAGKASFVLHEYLERSLKIFEDNTNDFDDWVMKQLPVSCHLSSESALVLIGEGRLWDAETVIRSVLEGTIKFLFICSGSAEERAQKIDEFWNYLPRLNYIKKQKKAQDLLSAVSNPESAEWGFIKDIVDNDFDPEFAETFSKKQRKALEQKWSFAEMMKQLSTQDEMKGIIGLAHGYSIGSHIIHQDADAINLIIDRNRRDTLRREALELAHGAREISDVLVLALMRYIYIQRVYLKKVETTFLDSHDEISQMVEELQVNFREIESEYID